MQGESNVDSEAISRVIAHLKGEPPAVGSAKPKPEELKKADQEAEAKLHELHQAQFTEGK